MKRLDRRYGPDIMDMSIVQPDDDENDPSDSEGSQPHPRRFARGEGQDDLTERLGKDLDEIKKNIKEMKKRTESELKGRIEEITRKNKELINISPNHFKRWVSFQRKARFLSLMKRVLKTSRVLGIAGGVAEAELKRKRLIEVVGLKKKRWKDIWVVYPTSVIHRVHVLTLLLIMMYLIAVFPLDLAFNLSSTLPIFYGIDLFITSYFCVDIFMSFITAYHAHNHLLVTDNKLIAINYLKKWFIIDLITVLPLDLIFNLNNFRFKRLLKLPRLIRLVNSMFQNTSSKKQTRGLILDKLKLVISSTRMIYMLQALCFILIFVHVCACLWIFMAGISEDLPKGNWILG